MYHLFHRKQVTVKGIWRGDGWGGSTGSVRRDGAQFDGQRVARLPVVLRSVVVAPAAVEVASAAEDGAIGQVEPQVFSHVTLGALPATDPGGKNGLKYGSGVLQSGGERGLSGPCNPSSLSSSALDVPV